MKLGDIVRLKSVKSHHGRNWFEFRPTKKDEVFICVFLGVEKNEPVEGGEVDLKAAMRTLGWVPAPEPKPVKKPKAVRKTR